MLGRDVPFAYPRHYVPGLEFGQFWARSVHEGGDFFVVQAAMLNLDRPGGAP
jgi:hypothetical protein